MKAVLGLISAILLAVVLSGALWVTLGPTSPSLARAERRLQDSAPGAFDPPCDPQRLGALKGTEAAREQHRCRQAADQRRRDSADLIQQVRSADAAEAMADLAYSQTVILATGTGVGLFTLFAALFAAFYARHAANEAQRSANVAELGLLHAKAVSDAELRAWLSVAVEVRRIEKSTDSFSFDYDVILTNVGKSVAKGVWPESNLIFFGSDETKDHDFGWWPNWNPPADVGPACLMPGETVAVRRWVPSPEAKMGWSVYHPDKVPRASPIVYVSVFYRTAMDDAWHRTDRAFTIGDKQESLLLGFLRNDQDFWGPEDVSIRPFSGPLAT